MAKTAKLKKKQVSEHSRAARRAAEPAPVIAAPKAASPTTDPKPHVLAAKSAGVSKQRKTKLKRAQRERYERGLERGADNMDKLELKRQKSKVKGQIVRSRSKAWDEVNGEGITSKRKAGAFDALLAQSDDDDNDEDDKKSTKKWGDEEMDDAEVNDTATTKQGIAVAAQPLPVDDDEQL